MTDNELIARYDGAVENGGSTLQNDGVVPILELEKKYKTYHYVEGGDGIWSSAVLRYNTDWNWLIPIIRRIFPDIQAIKDKNQGDSDVYGIALEVEGAIIGSLIDLDIESTYTAVVQAIKLITGKKE